MRAEIKTEIAASEARIRAELKTEIASSETRMKEYVDTKFKVTNAKIEALATRINDLVGYLNATNMLFGGMVALIVGGISIPQIIIAFNS